MDEQKRVLAFGSKPQASALPHASVQAVAARKAAESQLATLLLP
jgi:hypothetical protein